MELDGKKHSSVRLGSSVGNAPFQVSAFASSDCTNWIAPGSARGGVVVWESDTASAARQHPSSGGEGVSALAFDADGKSLVWGTGGQTLWRRDDESDSWSAGHSLPSARLAVRCLRRSLLSS